MTTPRSQSVSSVRQYRQPTYRVVTPCTKFIVQYYDDLQAPDEQTSADDLVLSKPLNLTIDNRGVQTLHICDPRVDGFRMNGFEYLVETTPAAQLKSAIIAHPRYIETVRVQAQYDQAMFRLRRKGQQPDENEPFGKVLRAVQNQRAVARQSRLESKWEREKEFRDQQEKDRLAREEAQAAQQRLQLVLRDRGAIDSPQQTRAQLVQERAPLDPEEFERTEAYLRIKISVAMRDSQWAKLQELNTERQKLWASAGFAAPTL
ncbi:hypothetical protein C1H76_0342 [Elsinoe australis]|uniref:Uncharacterized protein n=1 Tax=Elsinoe australis TaxID=40998 RepID=A0A4U7BBP0_9PEZI|nr:hypothetical protein C1H76_0342 [Elsinoe australis]